MTAPVRSYYGRPVLKRPVWEWKIAAYFFTGGLSAGSAMLAAGADLTGRPRLRRAGWLTSFGALLASTYFLVSDLGRPERFHHMLRVAKPTSAMSMGSWILAGYAPGVSVAALQELAPPRWRREALVRPAGLASAALAPAVAAYTATLLSQTAVPAWHESYRLLPFLFTGSAAAASGGWAMASVPVDEAGPARRLAAVGAAVELATAQLVEHRDDVTTVSYRRGRAERLLRAARACTGAGLVGTLLLGRRSRAASVASGAALVAGSLLVRLGVFEAGVDSAEDPVQTIAPQRARVE